MDQDVQQLIQLLKKPAASSESKLAALNAVKSQVKHSRVPTHTQTHIFEALRLAITQQSSSTLALSAFSTLGHIIKRLKIQNEEHAIAQLAPRLFPALQERLGDLKEPIRNAASQALGELYPFLTQDVENIVREETISGSANARAKETAMQWVMRMHRDEGMPFKSYVSPMVAKLEDSDGGVREAAKASLVELFRDAPDRAKTDLKKQLKAHSVRHAIATQVLSQIGAETGPPTTTSRPTTSHAKEGSENTDLGGSTRSLPSFDHIEKFANSINSEAAIPPPPEVVPMDPLYVHSQRELEDIFQDMLPHFEGKEDEHNWTPRDKAILKVRRLTKGNAPNEHHVTFLAGIKSIMEGILKVANTLRTTMATNGCQLVQELCRTMGPAMDPHVEILLQNFIKMSAVTKIIQAHNGKVTAEAIFQNCSYHARMMQHIWNAAQDKNASARQCVPEWLKIVLRRQAGYKTHFENSGGLELAEKVIRKGLDDSKPAVKEGMRGVYWTFAKDWPVRAEKIMGSLDEKSKAALRKDSHNPNADLHASTSSAAGPAAKERPGQNSRMALRELMAEQRRAKAAGTLPERPNSAMATMVSPAKQRSQIGLNSASRGQSHLRENRVVSNASTASSETPSAADGKPKSRSALMSGPVRRPKRPEIPRPQTADPYASRRGVLHRPETPAGQSPGNSPPKGTGASKSSMASTTASAARNRAKTAGERAAVAGSPSGSPVKRSPVPQPVSHGHPPVQQQRLERPGSKGSQGSIAEESREDDLTMVMPAGRAMSAGVRSNGTGLGHKRPALGQTMSVDSGIPAVAPGAEADEGFTMVIPNLNGSQTVNGRARSPLAYRSPLKMMFEEARERLERSNSPPRAQERLNGIEEALEAGATVRSPSPVKEKVEEIQIYEDPFTAENQDATAGEERNVLSELQVNENVRVQSPTQSQGSSASPAGSPTHLPMPNGGGGSRQQSPTRVQATPSQDRAEVLRSRRLLGSGIERIKTKTLDAHGFRRVQDLVRSEHDIWEGGKKYDELLSALLDYLRTFDQDPRLTSQAPHKAAGLKAQALGLVRALLTLQKKNAAAWYAKALVTVFVCRGAVEGSSSHEVRDMEKTVDDIVRAAQPEGCVDATLDFLPTYGSDEQGSRSVTMAISTLRRLLESAKAKNIDLGAERKVRLTATAARYLDVEDADVRKADVELASDLFELFGTSKTEFWNEFKGTHEGRLGLLTYYIARKSQANGGVLVQ